jgi:hypothetical protein
MPGDDSFYHCQIFLATDGHQTSASKVGEPPLAEPNHRSNSTHFDQQFKENSNASTNLGFIPFRCSILRCGLRSIEPDSHWLRDWRWRPRDCSPQLRQTTTKQFFPAANIRDVDPFAAIWPQQCVPSVRETYRLRGGLRPVTNRRSSLSKIHQVCQRCGLPILPYFLPTYSTTPRSNTGRS